MICLVFRLVSCPVSWAESTGPDRSIYLLARNIAIPVNFENLNFIILLLSIFYPKVFSKKNSVMDA
jgi:hypothetical protein